MQKQMLFFLDHSDKDMLTYIYGISMTCMNY